MASQTLIFLTIILLCSLSSVHAQCDIGEYQISPGNCVQCDISCSTCSSAQGCSTCYDQMYLVPVGNQVLCQLCYVINPVCSVCASAQKCLNCTNGYYLMSNKSCGPCSDIVPNCQYCVVDNNTNFICIQCNQPYVITNGQCWTNQTNVTTNSSTAGTQNNSQTTNAPANQQQGSNQQGNNQMGNNNNQQGNTQAGNNNQQGNNQMGNNNNQQGNTQNGNSQQSAGGCNSAQVLVNGQCILIIPYCIQYDPNTLTCAVCADTYGLSNQGYCIPSILLLINSPLPASTAPTTTATGDTQALPQTQNTQSSFTATSQTGSTAAGVVASSTSCTSPCLTCGNNSMTFCLTCITGYTTVDAEAFSGRCFPLN